MALGGELGRGRSVGVMAVDRRGVVGSAAGSAASRRRGGSVPPLLERGRFDDARQQGGEPPVLAFEPVDDPVDRLDVVILEPAPEGVGQQLLGQAAVEVDAVLVLEDLLQVADVL